jgi:HD-GYP domain-containing protein (c-di-GMP phosphodiesterase class II)
MNESVNLLQPYFAQHNISSLQRGLLSSLLTMAWAVEARDPYTGGHLWRVSQMSRLVAKSAGLSALEIETIALGGFLHDLGKIAVPDRILTKADRLTDDEFALIRNHPEAGWRLVMDHPLAALVEAPIRSHHEMPNGKGYPLGLSAAEIPQAAKIVGLCDAFDAMTSTRPYRAGMPVEKALSIIEQNLGGQFDEALGQVFLDIGKTGAFNHIVAHSDHGIPLLTCPACGPVVVMRRDQVIGEHLYCRCCAAEFELAEDNTGGKIAVATGHSGTEVQLHDTADKRVIDEVLDRLLAAV